jgi:4-hydroxy-tetrahydrodipicolinate synthase
MKTLSGAWPTMVTPFDSDLKIDCGAYRAMIAWYLQHRVGGLYACCLSSEMFHLTNEERLLLVQEAVQAAQGRVPVAATGNLGANLEEHIRFARQVADAGADVVMLVVPEFLDQEDELERYYMTLAESVEAPLGLYECPVPRSFHLSVNLVARLARSGRFIAYKETSCDIDKIRAHLAATQGTPLAILQANTPYMLDALRAGTPGSMTIAAIWIPDLVAAVIDKARANDPDAERLQNHLCALKLAQRSVHPIGSKYLLGKRGVPIFPRGRAVRELRPETLRALDYAAQTWFDEAGELLLAL